MMQTMFTVDANQLRELGKQYPPKCTTTGYTLGHVSGLVLIRLQHPDESGTVIEAESLIGICGACGELSWWREKDEPESEEAKQ